MGLLAADSNVQTCSNETWRRINISTATVNGIDIAPVRRSAIARLDNRMLTGFCSSFLRLTATIMNEFKRMVTGEAIDMITTKIQGKVVFFKFQENCGSCGQKNTDLIFVEGSMWVVSVLLASMLQWLHRINQLVGFCEIQLLIQFQTLLFAV